MALRFYNTLTRAKEDFHPIHNDWVGLYTCGPTVYNYAHIGNLRSYVFADILEKTLIYNNYNVKRVMNITDIGHLVSDGDDGDDKMTKGLLREGKKLTLKNMRELAEFYTEKFKEDLKILNLEIPKGLHFASDYIKEDIELIEKLQDKGYAYKTSDGIYFEILKFPNYFNLSGQKDTSELNTESRIELNTEKRNVADFALWKFDDKIGFPSPFGTGFPGWHIECSAMGIKFLGEQFDIHTGGVDHIGVHHTNEIAQSESATGKNPFVKVWMHNEHINIGESKMAKSGENFLTLNILIKKGINPMAYKLWLLSANYGTKMNFTFLALEGAENALKRLYTAYLSLGESDGQVIKLYRDSFESFINDDLNTPKALALIWDLIHDTGIKDDDKKATLLDFDKVLGLGLKNLKEEIIPEEVSSLILERELARKDKDWTMSDELRKKIRDLGYEVKDTDTGQEISKI